MSVKAWWNDKWPDKTKQLEEKPVPVPFKGKESRNRPSVAQKVPGGLGSQIP